MNAAQLRAVIIDDEPLARDSIRAMLESERDVVVAGEASGDGAAALIARTRPDIMFLDIQMPDVDGFALLQQIGPEAVPAVVFVTAYDRYALRAFEAHAIDYLLKPFDDARFHDALDRARERARNCSPIAAASSRRDSSSARARSRLSSTPRISTGSRRPTTTCRCTSASHRTCCVRR